MESRERRLLPARTDQQSGLMRHVIRLRCQEFYRINANAFSPQRWLITDGTWFLAVHTHTQLLKSNSDDARIEAAGRLSSQTHGSFPMIRTLSTLLSFYGWQLCVIAIRATPSVRPSVRPSARPSATPVLRRD